MAEYKPRNKDFIIRKLKIVNDYIRVSNQRPVKGEENPFVSSCTKAC